MTDALTNRVLPNPDRWKTSRQHPKGASPVVCGDPSPPRYKRRRRKRTAFGAVIAKLLGHTKPDPMPIARRLLGPRWVARITRAVHNADAHSGKLSRVRWREADSSRGRRTLALQLIIYEAAWEVQRGRSGHTHEATGSAVWRGRQAKRLGTSEKTVDRICKALRSARMLDYNQLPGNQVKAWMRGKKGFGYNIYRLDMPQSIAARMKKWSFRPPQLKSWDDEHAQLHPTLQCAAGRQWIEECASRDAPERAPPGGQLSVAAASLLAAMGIAPTELGA